MVLPIMKFFGIQPDYDFSIMKPGQNLNDISLAVMAQLKPVVENLKPTHIVVQGDTTSAAIAALLAFYQSIDVVHVEAGLRTYNMLSPWPEEFNRRLIGLASKWHFTPTPLASSNLLNEGVFSSQIYMVGNSGIDALRIASGKLAEQQRVERSASSQNKDKFNSKAFYILVTLHRRESFGQEMHGVMTAIKDIVDRHNQVVARWPLHQNPQVRQSFRDVFGEGHESVQMLEPLGYPEFVSEMMSADLIVTDSGGVQEEAPFLGKPILVCRQNTERPEAVDCGSARLVGTSREKIVQEIQSLLDKESEGYKRMAVSRTPFGDGHSSEKILDVICSATTC